MKLIRVGAAVLNQTPLDWEGNKANILEAIRRSQSKGISLLCLPELCITGYGCEDAFQAPATSKMAWQVLKEILPDTQGIAVAVGLPTFHKHALFNTVAFVVDRKIKGLVAKQHLAGDGIHYEPRWFKPWTAGVWSELHFEGESIPIGDLHFDCGGVKIGFEICEDAWVADRPGSALAFKGIDVILNPSASHFAFQKINVRKRFVLEGSRAFGVSYLYSNLLGNEAGRVIYDGGALIASAGKMLVEGKRFSFHLVDITEALIDVEATQRGRARVVSFQPRLKEDESCISCDFEYPEVQPEKKDTQISSWEQSPSIQEEEFSRALSLALFDFLRKSRSHGFVVSLSGGADSTAVSLLVGMLIQMGTQELGFEEFCHRLCHVPNLKAGKDISELTHRLLTCVYQSTQNSSEMTRNAAAQIAQMIGAQFIQLDVEPLVQGYTQRIEKVLGRNLNWETDDLALQNIQARVRAPGVWMLANIQNALLLATSNRSEAAVGYATMDGDTCGGLSPIAGIDKTFLRRWLAWMEKQGPAGLQPYPGLAVVNRQEPTAELKPSEAHQTDETDLMPYPVLDAIEKAAIRDKQSPLEIYLLMRVQFPHFTLDDLGKWVERFFILWCRNQWKRERYAPSFHLDDENLDPKTWCRFPILSGGFERELEELRQYLRNSSSS